MTLGTIVGNCGHLPVNTSPILAANLATTSMVMAENRPVKESAADGQDESTWSISWQPTILEPPRPGQDWQPEEVGRLLQQYPLPDQMVYAYGTAGFRYEATFMEPVMIRVGFLAVVRSVMQGGQAVGVMITASHNEETWNGVKLSDPHGGMMDPAGEQMAVTFTNERDTSTALSWLQEQLNVPRNVSPMPVAPVVHVGRDTRSHSWALCQLTIRAAQALGARIIDHGLVTTPMLHHCVKHGHPAPLDRQHVPELLPISPMISGYYDLLISSYLSLLETADHHHVNDHDVDQNPLLVDCACGIGFIHVQALADRLQQQASLSPRALRKIAPTNGPQHGPLNHGCGSEHVQKGITPPVWYEPQFDVNTPNKTYVASLDGDADRIVFFSCRPSLPPPSSGPVAHSDSSPPPLSFALLDGDKIACLWVHFLQEQLATLQAVLEPQSLLVAWPVLGVVQTAYANGASTAFLAKVLPPGGVRIAKTGVKFVHAAAHEYFDIGVYFEANGHGTIVFGDAFYHFVTAAHAELEKHNDAPAISKARLALQRLRVLPGLVNQAVGDALSDLLLVDAILQLQQWTVQNWIDLYTDLPSRQGKVQVADRSIIRTNDNETECVEPVQVQELLQRAMQEVPAGRAFVRPSGTEDVVRVYAEAQTRAQADALAQRAARIVYDCCQGVGAPPALSIPAQSHL